MNGLRRVLVVLAGGVAIVLGGPTVGFGAPPTGVASCVGQDVSGEATASGAAFGATAAGLAQSGTLGQVASAEARITTNCPG
jgi:hypothetical protein